MPGVAAISASDSIEDLTKPEALDRRSADKARRPEEMATSEPAESDAEWEQLEPVQRDVYKDTKLENCSNPASMGNQDPKQDIVSVLEEEEPSSGKGKKASPSSLKKNSKAQDSRNKCKTPTR